jgi:hypothetical protein
LENLEVSSVFCLKSSGLPVNKYSTAKSGFPDEAFRDLKISSCSKPIPNRFVIVDWSIGDIFLVFPNEECGFLFVFISCLKLSVIKISGV